MAYEDWAGVIDTSENNGPVDGQRAADAGVRYAIVRVHNGRRKDHTVEADVASYRAAGITVLAGYGFGNRYSRLGAAGQAREGALICRDLGLPTYMLDLEPDEGEPKDVARPDSGPATADYYRRMADAGIEVMGEPGIVYTGFYFWAEATGNTDRLADHDLIVASYPGYHTVLGAIVDTLPRGTGPAGWGALVSRLPASKGPRLPGGFPTLAGWQFSAGGNRQGSVYGTRGNDLDLNVIDPVVLGRWLDLAGPHPTPTPTPGTIPTFPEGDLMLAVLAPRGRNARFLATMSKTTNGSWAAYEAEWARSWDRDVQPFLDAGATLLEIEPEGMRNVHVDAVPEGDGWAEADFRRVG